MLAMLMPALVATLIAVLLFLSTRRWRLFAPGVYLGHALFSVLIYTVRGVVIYSNYALQSGPLWFAYCMVLILGYGWGGWIVWRLGRSEWSALESGASGGNTELNPWTAPAES
ncbi:MAG TPA: hypothetical protein VL860_13110, partial [Planctomycetota bacterium]|nr:hypothetical protein [Planctomycetota bacterium]